MIEKEFRDILPSVLLRLLVLFIAPELAALFQSTEQIPLFFSFTLPVVALWVAHNLGINAFKMEIRDRAFEYLFSLPISRPGILVAKIIPRLAVLLLLIAGHTTLFIAILQPMYEKHPETVNNTLLLLLHPVLFPIWCLFLFLMSFMFGLFDWKNAKVLVGYGYMLITAILALALHTQLGSAPLDTTDATIGDWLSAAAGGVLAALLVIIPTTAAFTAAYRRYSGPENSTVFRRFLLHLSLPLLVLLIAAVCILGAHRG